ncbi:large ribosomal subunit protein mL49 [Planococcus citri]|uniref:large ribosomal subunit protein mL49 n=1 Tax=Planococcus citri TaxID=170843 RepID=UPI0031F9F070
MLNVYRGLLGLQRINTTNLIRRCAHFDPKISKPDLDSLPSYEVSKDPKEWDYVKRLLPQTEIPAPPTEIKKYASGWKPQTVKPGEYPYYIERTKNHWLPVHLRIGHRGMKRRTVLRKINGDIHALADELYPYLQAKVPHKKLGMKVSEIMGEIRFMGDFVNDIKVWLEERNF